MVSLVALLAFVVSSAEAEKFTGIITDSSCRHDIGQFTFLQSSEFGSQPSVTAAVSIPFVCRVTHNESYTQGLTGSQLSDPDFVAKTLEEDGGEIEECINAVNVYMVVAPMELYNEDQACSAFQYSNVESTVSTYGQLSTFQQVGNGFPVAVALLGLRCDALTYIHTYIHTSTLFYF